MVCNVKPSWYEVLLEAFSINQHASICSGFGPEPPDGTREWKAWNSKRYDSVTGEAFPLCDCRTEKVFSHTDARCELNKFDAAWHERKK